MSDRVVEFVEGRIDQDGTYLEENGDSTRVATFADMRREAATALGIRVDDIKPEFGALETIILEAMHSAVGVPED